MASVTEIQAGIAQANEQAKQSFAALQQAVSTLEQAQGMLASVTQGSSQSEAEDANRLFAEAIRSIGEAQQHVNAGISTAESYSGRL